MTQDRSQYLEDAIRRLDVQISGMRSTGMIDPRLIENLKNQRLHFEEELAKISKPKRNTSIFTLLDEFDDEEIFKVPTKPNDPNKRSN
jgi:hypothetical protein